MCSHITLSHTTLKDSRGKPRWTADSYLTLLAKFCLSSMSQNIYDRRNMDKRLLAVFHAKLFVFLAIVSGTGCSSRIAATIESPRSNGNVTQIDIESSPDCGGRAVYAFLRLIGKTCDFFVINKELDTTVSLPTLADLSDCILHCGVSNQIVRLDPQELRVAIAPLLIHMPGVTPRDGHYAIVTAIDEKSVTVLDPTDARNTVYPWPNFVDNYSGYCIRSTSSCWMQSMNGGVLSKAVQYSGFAMVLTIVLQHCFSRGRKR